MEHAVEALCREPRALGEQRPRASHYARVRQQIRRGGRQVTQHELLDAAPRERAATEQRAGQQTSQEPRAARDQ
jgi:hypothetical protein